MPSLPEFDLSSTDLDDALEDADAVVLVTKHPGIDHVAIAEDSSLFVDLRGVTRGVNRENVVRL